MATDVHWAVGEGSEVRGPIQAIVLLLTGGKFAATQVVGWPGVR